MNELIPQEITRVSTSSEADAARRLILERERAYKEHLAEVSAKLTPATFGETKPEWTRLKKDGEELQRAVKAVRDRALEISGLKSLICQMEATRENLKLIYEEGWAKYCDLRDADLPPPQVHSYAIRMTCTDDALMKILTAAKKAGSFDVAWATAQTDKDAKIIGEWFARNA